MDDPTDDFMTLHTRQTLDFGKMGFDKLPPACECAKTGRAFVILLLFVSSGSQKGAKIKNE